MKSKEQLQQIAQVIRDLQKDWRTQGIIAIEDILSQGGTRCYCRVCMLDTPDLRCPLDCLICIKWEATHEKGVF